MCTGSEQGVPHTRAHGSNEQRCWRIYKKTQNRDLQLEWFCCFILKCAKLSYDDDGRRFNRHMSERGGQVSPIADDCKKPLTLNLHLEIFKRDCVRIDISKPLLINFRSSMHILDLMWIALVHFGCCNKLRFATCLLFYFKHKNCCSMSATTELIEYKKQLAMNRTKSSYWNRTRSIIAQLLLRLLSPHQSRIEKRQHWFDLTGIPLHANDKRPLPD